jgi:ADP-sugar diphosphatase
MISVLELPGGIVDDEDGSYKHAAVRELEEECLISVKPDELIDLTELACQEAADAGHLPSPGISTSGGACDEMVSFFYTEKTVTVEQLKSLENKLVAASEFGTFMTLHIVPWDKVWKMSGDSKTML